MIEFLDGDDTAGDEEELTEGRPPMRRPIRVAIALVLAAVVAVAVVLTLRDEGSGRRDAAPSVTPSVAPSSSDGPSSDDLVIVAPNGNPCQVQSDGREVCFLDHIPAAVTRAVRAVFPSAKVVTSNPGEIDPDGRLVDRQLSVDAGARKVTIRVEAGPVGQRPYRVQNAPGVRITTLDTAISHGRRVQIEAIDVDRKAVPRVLLARLARDGRLLATG